MFHRLNSANNPKGIVAFAATVVGAVCHRGRGIFFHIGDGAAIAFYGAGPVALCRLAAGKRGFPW